MSVTPDGSGTQTCVIGTEHFLASGGSSPGVFTFHIDPALLASGDFLIARIYQKVLTGGTVRVAYAETFQGAQPADAMIQIAVPISNDLSESQALRFSLQQTQGTGRDIPWKVLKHA